MAEFDELMEKIKHQAQISKPPVLSKEKLEEMKKAVGSLKIPEEQREVIKKAMNSPEFHDVNTLNAKKQSLIWDIGYQKKPNPPVTKAEMDNAEKSLGFALPPLLRKIYLEVGNGGFGPGYGFLPVNKRSSGKKFDESVVAMYQISISGDPENPQWKWPKGMLPCCDWGDNIYSCIDCGKEPFPIYRADLELFSEGDPKGLSMERPSLYDWIVDWVEDRLQF